MLEITEIASGLQFPEGPIAMPDGSVVLVEMQGQRLTRIGPDGTKQTIAEVPGGPNGATVGPDGDIYVCNNGGWLGFAEVDGLTVIEPADWSGYIGGRIQRVHAETGTVTDLYTECDGRPLRAPNDLVMDGHGGLWFTDHGTLDPAARTSDLGAVYYAKADGSSITEVVFPTDFPNGIGLSPDGHTLYWSHTFQGRIHRRTVIGPGELAPVDPYDPTTVLCTLPGLQLLDSLAVDSAGYVCAATMINGGITVVSPDGSSVEHIPTGDYLTTNICFGGDDSRTAYITLSGTGRLVSMRWPRRGLRLAHQ